MKAHGKELANRERLLIWWRGIAAGDGMEPRGPKQGSDKHKFRVVNLASGTGGKVEREEDHGSGR